MANTGTLTLSRITSGTTATLLDMTTSLPQGTLVLGAAAANDLALGIARSSTLTLGGGSLRNASAYVGSIPPSAWSTPVGAVGSVVVTGGTWANGGDLFLGASGTGTLNVSGGLVTLASATIAPAFSAYSYSRRNGGIVVTGGTVAASGNLRVGASGTGRLAVSGSGELRATNVTALAAMGTGSGGFTNGSSFGLDTTNAPGGVFAYAGSIANPNSGSNALGLVKLGSGTLALSGSNSFTGPTAIRAGTALYTRRAAMYGGDAAQFTAARLTTASGAMLAVAVGGTDGFTSSDVDAIAAIGTGSTGFLNGSWLGLDTSTAVGGTFSYSGPIYDTNGETNSLGVAKLGPGTLVLGAASDYSGGTLITGGGLVLAAPQALPAAGPVTVASGSLVLGAGSLQIGTLAGAGDGVILPAAAGSLTLSSSSSASAAISGSGVFAKLGAGTLTLTGANTYAGGTQVLAGRLIGTVGTIRGPLANAAAVTFAQTVDGTFSTPISGTGSLTKTGGGTLTLAAAGSLSGPVTVQQGGLRLGQAAALGSAEVTPLAGGTLSLAPRLQATVGGLNPSAGGVIDVGSGLVTVAGGLSNSSLLAALLAGRGDGSWNGTAGILSTAARANLAAGTVRTVGWLDNGDGSKTFAYAAPGDTNLDWQVDILDAANFVAGGRFDTWKPATWNEGDFSYDGVVDILDAADFLSTSLFDVGGYNAAGGSLAAVPEPTVPGIAALALGAAGLAARRRRQAPHHPQP